MFSNQFLPFVVGAIILVYAKLLAGLRKLISTFNNTTQHNLDI
jgi:hypothetical protein